MTDEDLRNTISKTLTCRVDDRYAFGVAVIRSMFMHCLLCVHLIL